MFTTMEKKEFIFKKKSIYIHFNENVQDLTIFSKNLGLFLLHDINSCDIIFWDFIGSPHIILGKKSKKSSLFANLETNIISRLNI